MCACIKIEYDEKEYQQLKKELTERGAAQDSSMPDGMRLRSRIRKSYIEHYPDINKTWKDLHKQKRYQDAYILLKEFKEFLKNSGSEKSWVTRHVVKDSAVKVVFPVPDDHPAIEITDEEDGYVPPIVSTTSSKDIKKERIEPETGHKAKRQRRNINNFLANNVSDCVFAKFQQEGSEWNNMWFEAIVLEEVSSDSRKVRFCDEPLVVVVPIHHITPRLVDEQPLSAYPEGCEALGCFSRKHSRNGYWYTVKVIKVLENAVKVKWVDYPHKDSTLSLTCLNPLVTMPSQLPREADTPTTPTTPTPTTTTTTTSTVCMSQQIKQESLPSPTSSTTFSPSPSPALSSTPSPALSSPYFEQQELYSVQRNMQESHSILDADSTSEDSVSPSESVSSQEQGNASESASNLEDNDSEQTMDVRGSNNIDYYTAGFVGFSIPSEDEEEEEEERLVRHTKKKDINTFPNDTGGLQDNIDTNNNNNNNDNNDNNDNNNEYNDEYNDDDYNNNNTTNDTNGNNNHTHYDTNNYTDDDNGGWPRYNFEDFENIHNENSNSHNNYNTINGTSDNNNHTHYDINNYTDDNDGWPRYNFEDFENIHNENRNSRYNNEVATSNDTWTKTLYAREQITKRLGGKSSSDEYFYPKKIAQHAYDPHGIIYAMFITTKNEQPKFPAVFVSVPTAVDMWKNLKRPLPCFTGKSKKAREWRFEGCFNYVRDKLKTNGKTKVYLKQTDEPYIDSRQRIMRCSCAGKCTCIPCRQNNPNNNVVP